MTEAEKALQRELRSATRVLARLVEAREAYLADRGRLEDHENNKTWLVELSHKNLKAPCYMSARDFMATLGRQVETAREYQAQVARMLAGLEEETGEE